MAGASVACREVMGGAGGRIDPVQVTPYCWLLFGLLKAGVGGGGRTRSPGAGSRVVGMSRRSRLMRTSEGSTIVEVAKVKRKVKWLQAKVLPGKRSLALLCCWGGN